MNDVYIIAPLRTAIGNFMGSLSEIHPAKLAAIVIREVLKKTGLEPEQVNEVILGNVLGAGMGQNLARQAAVAAGIPVDRTAFTVNMVCGSGLRSVVLAAQAVRAGDADIMVAGGTENMSLAPYILPGARTGYRMGNAEIVDYRVRDRLWDIFNEYHMGITAENLAEKYGISRDDQDAFAAQSQNRAEAAIAAGKFAAEIVAYPVPQRKGDPKLFVTDEYVRPGTTAEQLHKLKP
ncbi:MAG: acetyl-CoA C-acetyltransferase, partial [Spirochaetales bacterium]